MGSLYERFHSGEEVEWHPEAFSQGMEACMRGFSYSDRGCNPYTENREGWMYKSFVAGWTDADMCRNEWDKKGDPQ